KVWERTMLVNTPILEAYRMYAGTPSHSHYSHHLSRSHKTVSTWSVLYVQDNPAASLCRKSFPLHEF
ncbi:hypothetical protein, partial [Phocaeicola plebeius]|uniref:hypothetical protein n=1 Tax=Phocaeicola plebeius TaxID=310297 RepID=UPI0039F565D7